MSRNTCSETSNIIKSSSCYYKHYHKTLNIWEKLIKYIYFIINIVFSNYCYITAQILVLHFVINTTRKLKALCYNIIVKSIVYKKIVEQWIYQYLIRCVCSLFSLAGCKYHKPTKVVVILGLVALTIQKTTERFIETLYTGYLIQGSPHRNILTATESMLRSSILLRSF